MTEAWWHQNLLPAPNKAIAYSVVSNSAWSGRRPFDTWEHVACPVQHEKRVQPMLTIWRGIDEHTMMIALNPSTWWCLAHTAAATNNDRSNLTNLARKNTDRAERKKDRILVLKRLTEHVLKCVWITMLLVSHPVNKAHPPEINSLTVSESSSFDRCLHKTLHFSMCVLSFNKKKMISELKIQKGTDKMQKENDRFIIRKQIKQPGIGTHRCQMAPGRQPHGGAAILTLTQKRPKLPDCVSAASSSSGTKQGDHLVT